MSRASNVSPAVEPRLVGELTSIVSRAAAAILAASRGPLAQRTKADQSPVTAADEAAEAVILDGLRDVLPGLAVVSEEAADRTPPGALGEHFVLVDPLDGTRELLAGRPEYTVNLAVVAEGRPVVGIVSAPAQGVVWRGVAGRGAERLLLVPGAPAGTAQECRPIRTRAAPPGGLVAAVSRSHLNAATETLLDRLQPSHTMVCGSSIKFCLVAEGRADVYPRLAPTREWDVAAGHAVLAAAGGSVTAPNGRPLRYGDVAGSFLVPAFIAWGDPAPAGG